MKKLFFISIIITVFISCTPKNAEEAKTGDAKKVTKSVGETYSLNTSATIIQWRGTKPGGEHHGSINTKEGKLILENNTIIGGSISIDMNSIINTDLESEMNAKLVGHLKSKDFFHTQEFPYALFKIISISKFEGELPETGIKPSHNITGNLSMRGETKSISFPIMITINDSIIIAETNEFALNRTLWGVNFKSKSIFDEFKDDFIGDMMNLRFKAEFKKND